MERLLRRLKRGYLPKNGPSVEEIAARADENLLYAAGTCTVRLRLAGHVPLVAC